MAWITRKQTIAFLVALITAILVQMQDKGVERLVDYVYNTAETYLDNKLNDPDSLRSYPYNCPKYSAKYLREIPHGKYIAWREEDIERLKQQFDSFEDSKEVVNVVYIVGVPGSGKTELARQFGKSIYCQRNGAPIVVTLNAEDPYQFKLTLALSIWHIEEGSKQRSKDIANLKKTEVDDLFHQLKELLRKRPGWMLIIDNIRDSNIAQKDIYQHLPIPGPNEQWGTGKMLITTQIPLVRDSYGRYFRTVHNTGLTLSDATNFLRELLNESSRCDAAFNKAIVEKLELLPLSIMAAGDRIRSEMETNTTYRCRDYLSEYSAEFSILSAQYRSVTGYNLSMLAALHLTITNTLEIHSNVFRDFFAFIGLATVDQRHISVKYVKGFLTRMGHTSEECEKVLDFPLVYFSKVNQLFHVHQVVSHAFREVLNRTSTNEALQQTLQSISHYFADHHKLSEFKIVFHYVDLLQSLPTLCTYLDTCLIARDAEHLDTVITLFFYAFFWQGWILKKPDVCSKLDAFLFRLRSLPVYLNRISVPLEFKGYQALSVCYTILDKVNGSFLVATKTLRLIKKVAPDNPELHTLPVSWFLLKLNNLDHGERLYHVTFFLLFPHYLKFPHDTVEIRRKLCLSLYTLTHILIPRDEERVREYCNPDFNDHRLYREFIANIPDKIEYFSIRNTSYRPFIMDRHLSLGRNNRLCGASGKSYGICAAQYKWTISGIGLSNFRFYVDYIDYDKLGGLERFEITVHKYRAVLVFLDLVYKMQIKLNWKRSNMTCQSIKYQLMTFSTETELQKASKVKTNMKSFHEKLLLFVDSYCASLPNVNVTELNVIFYRWYIRVLGIAWDRQYYDYFNFEVLIDDLLQAAGLQSKDTKEITEMIIEIVATTLKDATIDRMIGYGV